MPLLYQTMEGVSLTVVVSTLEILPHVTEAVDGKIPVLFDGGVRRGSDVFKAIALGADLVLIGRLAIWGLDYKGQEGVETVVNILERELSRTMALAGVANIADIKKAALHVTRETFRISKL
jgi:(S)-2-hydroxy-acid oxidase